MTPKEKKILEMQCESTRRCLERPPELDLTWLRRPLPKEAQVVKEDGSVDLNVREISEEEYNREQKLRYGRGAQFEDARTNYLMAKKDKINWQRLGHMITTDHVISSKEKIENAIMAFLKTNVVEKIKSKFKELMRDVKKLDVWR